MVKKWYYELENKFTQIRCNKMIIMPNHLTKKIWQRNYWEHIIRNKLELNEICKLYLK